MEHAFCSFAEDAGSVFKVPGPLFLLYIFAVSNLPGSLPKFYFGLVLNSRTFRSSARVFRVCFTPSSSVLAGMPFLNFGLFMFYYHLVNILLLEVLSQ